MTNMRLTHELMFKYSNDAKTLFQSWPNRYASFKFIDKQYTVEMQKLCSNLGHWSRFKVFILYQCLDNVKKYKYAKLISIYHAIQMLCKGF